jgi:hypothetical protein
MKCKRMGTLAKDSIIESLATEQWSFRGWKTPPPLTLFPLVEKMEFGDKWSPATENLFLAVTRR